MKRSLVAIVLSLLLVAALPAAAQGAGTQNNPGPGQDFERISPESAGLDSQALSTAVTFATSRNAASVRVLRHGKLVATSVPDIVSATIPNNLMSSTKGVVSLLTGRALALGKLSLDDPIGKYVTEADAAHARITIRQLLTQSSGLQFSWAADFAALDNIRQVLSLAFVHEPGTYFEYAQTTCSLLAYTVERAVGRDLQEFAQDELFQPLGIPRSDWFWLRDAAGHTLGYAFLFMPPRDLPRLGQLMLQGGVWNGKRLLPASFVAAAGSSSATNPGYGYLLWTNQGDHVISPSAPTRKDVQHPVVASAPRDMYGFFGMLDQLIFVIPSWDMVIVRTGLPGNYDIADPQADLTALEADWAYEFFRLMGKAVKDAAYTDPGPYPGGGGFEGIDVPRMADPLLTVNSVVTSLPSLLDPQAGTGSLGTEIVNTAVSLLPKVVQNLLDTGPLCSGACLILGLLKPHLLNSGDRSQN